VVKARLQLRRQRYAVSEGGMLEARDGPKHIGRCLNRIAYGQALSCCIAETRARPRAIQDLTLAHVTKTSPPAGETKGTPSSLAIVVNVPGGLSSEFGHATVAEVCSLKTPDQIR
jgi:hypothetical protein